MESMDSREVFSEMIDWEEIIKTEGPEDLREVKLWLFQESMRLERERREFTDSVDKLRQERDRFEDERDEQNRRMALERKRLNEENLFFDKKMAILQDGFRQLEEDRRNLEQERIRISVEREQLAARNLAGFLEENLVTEVLFRNANNPLTLRKRYRDLVKIFHPDNLAGDAEIIQLINSEFARRSGEE